MVASLLSAAVYLYWRVNEALRGDYETIHVVQMVEDYVTTHDGRWPLSWEDLDGTETAMYVAPLDSSYFRKYTTVLLTPRIVKRFTKVSCGEGAKLL